MSETACPYRALRGLSDQDPYPVYAQALSTGIPPSAGGLYLTTTRGTAS